MRTHRLFVTQPLSSGSLITLDEKASHYLGKVLRVKVGHSVNVFNGEGGSFEAGVSSVSKKTVSLQLGAFNPENNMPARKLHIAVGVSKGDKMDWLVQKATELGAFSIQPLLTEFCDVKLSEERFQKKINHWQQIAISSSEQCERNLVPEVLPQRKMDDWLNEVSALAPIWVFHPSGDKTIKNLAIPDEIVLCFGPEGGFSDSEMRQVKEGNACAVSLGSRILRAETAPLATLAILQYL